MHIFHLAGFDPGWPHRVSVAAFGPTSRRHGAFQQVLEDKANLVLLQRLMKAPTLESYVARGRQTVAEWAQSRFQQRNKPPPDGPPMPMPPLPPPEGVLHVVDEDRTPKHEGTTMRDAKAATTLTPTMVVTETAAEAAAAVSEVGVGGAGGEDWWCVKAAGGNGGLDIWVLHEGNWKSVTEKLSDDESYVIQVRTGEAWHAATPTKFRNFARDVC